MMGLAQKESGRGFSVPRYVVLSYLTIFSIGAQYFINLSYLLSQTTIQNTFGNGTYSALVPSVLSYIAFATFLVIGPPIAKKYGLRNMYLSFVSILFLGSVGDILAPNTFLFDLGRLLQGAGAGSLYMVMVPLVAIAIPTKKRNWFVFIILSGLFGATGLGGIFGGLSLSVDAWRWLFVLSAILPATCLLLGFAVLPRQKPAAQPPIDKWGTLLLFTLAFVLIFPLKDLEQYGISSFRVWPLFLLSLLLMMLLIAIEANVENPIIPFQLLAAPKPLLGTIMTATANVAVTCAVLGISGYLINVEQVHFLALTEFFVSFLIGTLASGLLSAWLYDKLGAGILGAIASIIVVYVGFAWNRMGTSAGLFTLGWQFTILGAALGIILVTGSLGGTLAAKEISDLPSLSMGMQYFRNLFSAFGSPVFVFAIVKYSEIHYANLRSRFVTGSPFEAMAQNKMTTYLSSAPPGGNTQALAKYALVNQFQTESLLFAYQSLFTILFIFGLVMLVSAIGLALTGKGLAIAQEEDLLVGLIPTNA